MEKTPGDINPQILRPKYIKYPFSGIASNLIDKFLVLGYDQKDIEHTLLREEPKPVNIKNNYLKYIDFPERPTIMNEICFNYNKESQENDLLLQLIFPNCPKLYFLEKKYIKEQKEQYDSNEETNNYTIIFSINPLDINNSRKSFNGLGYIFYIKKEHRDDNNELDGLIYYPITYVILSEYPYFYHFNKICKNIYIQMKKKTDEIPIDIILYNAIKFCPSPININLNLSFGATLSSNMKPEITANHILNQLYSKNKSENLNGIPFIFFNQLSGYPILDFNLSFIFNLLEPNMIIKVFILTFLEYDIIFLSSMPEILNMLIYIFCNLNYPFNEQIYYWHVVSVSADTFMNDMESKFVGKASSSIYGVCCDGNQNFDSSKRLDHVHFILDIDNKELKIKGDEREEDQVSNMNNLVEFLRYIDESIPEIDLQDANKEGNIIDEEYKKNYFNDGINLHESINNLAFALNRRFRAVTNINYNEKNYRPTFFIPYENESEMDTLRENLQIQKAFYTFLVQILSSIMREFPVETYEIKEKKPNPIEDFLPLMINIKKKKKLEDDECLSEKPPAYRAGLTFKQLLRESSKYSSFIGNFCQYHDCIDLSKIPYSFFYEYLYFSKISPNYMLNAVDIFLIMDQFYGKIKKLDFLEMIKEKQEDGKKDKYNLIKSINLDEKMNNVDNLKNISNFSYDKFENYYKEHLRAYINREQEDDKNIFVKDQGGSKQFKTYKRNNFYLSQRILDIYIYYLNDNFEQLKDIFKLTNCEYKIAEEPKNEIKNPKQNNINKNNKNVSKDNLIHDFIIIEESKEQLSAKEKEKKKKLFIQKQEHAKLFGTYELIEINDLIEKHLIKEKYFSSYEIMKFSLLSIIAITINLKNKQISNVEVIKILCDFCQITKSMVRKYMNIYLNIFTTMKLYNWLDKIICDECINIIIIYFKKTNTFPTEDTIKPILKSEIQDYKSETPVDYISIEKFKSTNKSIREKRAEFYKKSDKKKEDQQQQLSDYIEKVYTGWYYTSKNKLASNIEFYAKKYGNLYYALTHKKGDFVPKTPLELYATTNKLLLKFLSKFSIDENEYVELGIIVLSLLYYFKMDFFLPKWIFKAGNINNEKAFESDSYSNNNVDREIIKQLVINIIYILLDLYEAILSNIKK